ncbi:MAG TPA: glycosyltransferase family 2 protein [Acetobacteraceae bacterium]|nr:glycosyltransferase family 2 protein [Acetobacteraceae bacterium]
MSADLLSVVVPVHNEGPNLAPLIGAIEAALADLPHEIVYVDDGSTDDTPARLAEIASRTPALRVIRHRRSCGQSAAVITGIRQACGGIIATLDGDGQNDPADIPALHARLLAEEKLAPGPVLIAGHRVSRRDSAAKQIGSRFANTIRSLLLRDATPDTGCGLKLFRRQAFLDLPQFDHMHRFLPALFIRAGGRIVSVPVRHHPRREGASHYTNWKRLKVGVVDLMGVAWLQRRWRRPELDSGT